MVSFISITQGISICLFASSMMFNASALPVAGHEDSSTDSSPSTTTNSDSTPTLDMPNGFQMPTGFPTAFPTDWLKNLPKGGSFPTDGAFPTDWFKNLPTGSFPTDWLKNLPTGAFPTGAFPTGIPSFGKRETEDNTAPAEPSIVSNKPETHDISHIPLNTTHIESRSDNNNNNDATEMATSSQVNELTMYAGVASTAYCRTVVPLKQWSCVQCKKWVSDGEILTTFTSAVSDTNGFVLRSKSQKTIYLVFRGTNSYQSAMTDMIGTPVAYGSVSGAYVHAGFYSSVKEVINSYYPKIQSEIKANPDYKVVVTGHSLGGAQALLAGVDLLQRDSSKFTSKNVKIYTIGQPRVGNKKFAQYVDSTGIDIHRSVHKADMVPQVPPRYSGFFHVGVESWIKRDPSTTQICTSNLESDKCSYTTSAMTNAIDHLTYFGISEGSCL
ncbi:hypothetical protein G6F56_007914 [Rhizopus delemar]|uniref:Fungal lipase-type domain-containing protein n=1 Tax=Rhizopus stolonifer TaxID=4846 RepID=A0A367IP51_RHIST|nr:hypothetical protein G6F56_007914 [Rhizopus delemar]RCH79281.1 hypothetical protein CU098_004404 [Rhizopus stolonifer]